MFWGFCELSQGLEVQNKSNTMLTPLWVSMVGSRQFQVSRQFQSVVHSKLLIWKNNRAIPLSCFGFKSKVQTVWGIQYLRMFLERSKNSVKPWKWIYSVLAMFSYSKEILWRSNQIISEMYSIRIPPWIVRNKELLGIHANYDFSLLHCDVLNGYCSCSKVPWYRLN